MISINIYFRETVAAPKRLFIYAVMYKININIS